MSTATSTTAAVTTAAAATTAAATAGAARMLPTTGQVADCTDTLTATTLSRYWSELAETLIWAIAHIHDTHLSVCRRPGCRTCAAIRTARAWTTAHDQLATQGHLPHPTRGFQP